MFEPVDKDVWLAANDQIWILTEPFCHVTRHYLALVTKTPTGWDHNTAMTGELAQALDKAAKAFGWTLAFDPEHMDLSLAMGLPWSGIQVNEPAHHSGDQKVYHHCGWRGFFMPQRILERRTHRLYPQATLPTPWNGESEFVAHKNGVLELYTAQNATLNTDALPRPWRDIMAKHGGKPRQYSLDSTEEFTWHCTFPDIGEGALPLLEDLSAHMPIHKNGIARVEKALSEGAVMRDLILKHHPLLKWLPVVEMVWPFPDGKRTKP